MPSIVCGYCKAKLEANAEDNENKWGGEWPLADPDDLTYYCTNCGVEDEGWALKKINE